MYSLNKVVDFLIKHHKQLSEAFDSDSNFGGFLQEHSQYKEWAEIFFQQMSVYIPNVKKSPNDSVTILEQYNQAFLQMPQTKGFSMMRYLSINIGLQMYLREKLFVLEELMDRYQTYRNDVITAHRNRM